MESEPQKSDPKRDSLTLEDSFTQSTTNFNLFQAYREGNLDCEVISTQKASVRTNENPPPGEYVSKEASSEKTGNLPRSWCLPQSSSVDTSETKMRNVVSLGALCKPQEFHSSVDCVPLPITITRETYKPTDSLVKMIRSNAILVNQRQRGNPLLKHIHNVAWEYADIEPDYVVGRNNCVYFLSLRYHNLNSEYIFERVRQTKQNYQLSVLLCQVDVTDPHYPLKELCKLCLAEKLTLMLAWSPEEAACYLEAYKALENKPPDGLMPEAAANTDQLAQITDFLTSVRPVTKADAAATVNTFKTVADIILAEQDRLEACPGFGKRKAQKLYSVFRMPFLREQI